MLASFASLIQLTVTTTPYKAQPLRPPLLSFDGSAGELLESHHASTRPYARKPYSCFSAANSASLYAPSSSPNIKRTNRRRSPTPKLHPTQPRRPIASPTTVSLSTRPCPPCLIQPARPKQALAMRVPPLLRPRIGRHCGWHGAPRFLSLVRSPGVGWTLVFDL